MANKADGSRGVLAIRARVGKRVEVDRGNGAVLARAHAHMHHHLMARVGRGEGLFPCVQALGGPSRLGGEKFGEHLAATRLLGTGADHKSVVAFLYLSKPQADRSMAHGMVRCCRRIHSPPPITRGLARPQQLVRLARRRRPLDLGELGHYSPSSFSCRPRGQTHPKRRWRATDAHATISS